MPPSPCNTAGTAPPQAANQYAPARKSPFAVAAESSELRCQPSLPRAQSQEHLNLPLARKSFGGVRIVKTYSNGNSGESTLAHVSPLPSGDSFKSGLYPHLAELKMGTVIEAQVHDVQMPVDPNFNLAHGTSLLVTAVMPQAAKATDPKSSASNGVRKPSEQSETSLVQLSSPGLQAYQGCIIPKRELTWVRNIGSGAQGTIWLGLWNHSEVALKVFNGQAVDSSARTSPDGKVSVTSSFWQEISALRRLSAHPRVVHFCGLAVEDGPPVLVMEYYAGGSLFDLLCRARQDASARAALTWRRRFDILHDVASGMCYLHSQRCVHGDLRSPNILLGRDRRAKIADLGLAKLLSAVDVRSVSGSANPRWSAPEVLQGHGRSMASDVFSFGVMMWEVLTCRLPYEDMMDYQLLYQLADPQTCDTLRPSLSVAEALAPGSSPLPDDTLTAYRELMSRCWHAQVAARPAFTDIPAQLVRLRRAAVRYAACAPAGGAGAAGGGSCVGAKRGARSSGPDESAAMAVTRHVVARRARASGAPGGGSTDSDSTSSSIPPEPPDMHTVGGSGGGMGAADAALDAVMQARKALVTVARALPGQLAVLLLLCPPGAAALWRQVSTSLAWLRQHSDLAAAAVADSLEGHLQAGTGSAEQVPGRAQGAAWGGSALKGCVEACRAMQRAVEPLTEEAEQALQDAATAAHASLAELCRGLAALTFALQTVAASGRLHEAAGGVCHCLGVIAQCAADATAQAGKAHTGEDAGAGSKVALSAPASELGASNIVRGPQTRPAPMAGTGGAPPLRPYPAVPSPIPLPAAATAAVSMLWPQLSPPGSSPFASAMAPAAAATPAPSPFAAMPTAAQSCVAPAQGVAHSPFAAAAPTAVHSPFAMPATATQTPFATPAGTLQSPFAAAAPLSPYSPFASATAAPSYTPLASAAVPPLTSRQNIWSACHGIFDNEPLPAAGPSWPAEQGSLSSDMTTRGVALGAGGWAPVGLPGPAPQEEWRWDNTAGPAEAQRASSWDAMQLSAADAAPHSSRGVQDNGGEAAAAAAASDRGAGGEERAAPALGPAPGWPPGARSATAATSSDASAYTPMRSGGGGGGGFFAVLGGAVSAMRLAPQRETLALGLTPKASMSTATAHVPATAPAPPPPPQRAAAVSGGQGQPMEVTVAEGVSGLEIGLDARAGKARTRYASSFYSPAVPSAPPIVQQKVASTTPWATEPPSLPNALAMPGTALKPPLSGDEQRSWDAPPASTSFSSLSSSTMNSFVSRDVLAAPPAAPPRPVAPSAAPPASTLFGSQQRPSILSVISAAVAPMLSPGAFSRQAGAAPGTDAALPKAPTFAFAPAFPPVAKAALRQAGTSAMSFLAAAREQDALQEPSSWSAPNNVLSFLRTATGSSQHAPQAPSTGSAPTPAEASASSGVGKKEAAGRQGPEREGRESTAPLPPRRFYVPHSGADAATDEAVAMLEWAMTVPALPRRSPDSLVLAVVRGHAATPLWLAGALLRRARRSGSCDGATRAVRVSSGGGRGPEQATAAGGAQGWNLRQEVGQGQGQGQRQGPAWVELLVEGAVALADETAEPRGTSSSGGAGGDSWLVVPVVCDVGTSRQLGGVIVLANSQDGLEGELCRWPPRSCSVPVAWCAPHCVTASEAAGGAMEVLLGGSQVVQAVRRGAARFWTHFGGSRWDVQFSVDEERSAAGGTTGGVDGAYVVLEVEQRDKLQGGGALEGVACITINVASDWCQVWLPVVGAASYGDVSASEDEVANSLGRLLQCCAAEERAWLSCGLGQLAARRARPVAAALSFPPPLERLLLFALRWALDAGESATACWLLGVPGAAQVALTTPPARMLGAGVAPLSLLQLAARGGDEAALKLVATLAAEVLPVPFAACGTHTGPAAGPPASSAAQVKAAVASQEVSSAAAALWRGDQALEGAPAALSLLALRGGEEAEVLAPLLAPTCRDREAQHAPLRWARASLPPRSRGLCEGREWMARRAVAMVHGQTGRGEVVQALLWRRLAGLLLRTLPPDVSMTDMLATLQQWERQAASDGGGDAEAVADE